MTASGLLAGWVADAVIGDPRRGHPVAGFGTVALHVERVVYAPCRTRGTLTCAGLDAVTAAGAEVLARTADRHHPRGRTLVLAATTWAALGGRSLGTTALGVAAHLDAGDLPRARAALPALAGRDAADLDEAGVARAVVESVAENTSDAVVGALVWGTVAGPAGVAAFRAANTLDAMVGHRTPRYTDYGWAAARLDDLLGLVPSRLTALLASACAPITGGSPAAALGVACRDRGAHPSPNAGPVEAAFAGALGLRLGGPVSYGGRRETRPALGDGAPPAVGDIARAVVLSRAVGLTAALLTAAVRAARPGRRASPVRGPR